MYIWEAKTQNMKKQLLFVFFLFFSFITVVNATGRDSIKNKNSKNYTTPPVNDECSNAISIPVNPDLELVSIVTGTTEGATPSDNELENDIWFKFTATQKKHLIHFTPLAGGEDFLRYDFCSGSCTNLMVLFDSNFGFPSVKVAQNLTIGTTYRIRMALPTFLNSPAAFTIAITTPLPAVNDECSAATTIPVNANIDPVNFVPVSMLGATVSNNPISDCIPGYSDLWYKFVATSDKHIIRVFDLTQENSIQFEFFSGSSCSSESYMGCAGIQGAYLQLLVPGNTYRIRVANYSQDQAQSFDFKLAVITPSPLINDECINSITIPVNTALENDLFVNGSSYAPGMSVQEPQCNYNNVDVWFDFIATSNQHIINFFDLDESIDVAYTLYSGNDCDNLTFISCNYTENSLFNNLVIGTTYRIRVTNYIDYSFSSASFKLAITTVPIPTNDQYGNATIVPINATLSSDLFVSGTTYGASSSPEPIACVANVDDDVWYSFTATSTLHLIKFFEVVPSPSYFRYALYKVQNSGALEEVYCGTRMANFYNTLIPNSVYKIRVFNTSASPSVYTNFNLSIGTAIAPSNDECIDATIVNVSTNGSLSNSTTYGNVLGATPSLGIDNSCPGSEDDDVWFKFVAGAQKHIVTLENLQGLASNLNMAVYSGTCSSLSLVSCSTSGALSLNADNFVVGQIYYVRVWSNSTLIQDAPFIISVKVISTCQNVEPFCGSTVDDPYIFKNTTGLPSATGVACLNSIPNPTYYTLKVSESGPLVYNIMQSTSFDSQGNPIGNYLDVDYVAWGPFESADSCSQIVMTPCSTCPDNSMNPNFYPLGNIVDCSYSNSYTETLSIPNAIAGQYYVVLITNFNGNPGFIKLTQTNSAEPNAGKTACADKIQLVAFVDSNNNGLKDAMESNFTYGSFTYQKNNIGTINYSSNPFGIHSIYDDIPTNTYDFNYQIDSEYASFYTAIPTAFNDLNIPVGSGTQTLYFPITLTQNYSDVDVHIVALESPRPGFEYTHKIVYRNLGNLATSGTITYNKDNSNIAINEILPAATTTNSTGFTSDYNNLLPGEIRFINVKMLVSTIPTINLGDIAINAVAISSVDNDINVANNNFTSIQTVVGSYDPNDKNEARGSTIEIGQFNQDDYLFYTIRFQNTGTASADTVRIEDTLESEFDFASFRMVSASHNYTVERVNNHVVWTFNNINLPGEFQDEPGSHGYVTFKIKLHSGFEVGDVIENKAEIYFDFNPPIITNTFESTFIPNLSVGIFDNNDLLVYPNPVNEIVQVQLKNATDKIQKVTIYDIIGKSVKTVSGISSNQTNINVSNLSAGVYLLEITTENNLKQSKKLIIN